MSADLKSPFERSAALLTAVDEHGLKNESIARHLPYLSALDDHILMTRQGDLLASAVIEGLDSFTSDDGDLDVAGQSFARLVGQLGDGFGYHVNKITIPETVALRDFEGDSFEAEVDRRWRDHLTSRNLKRRVILLTVCLRPMIGGRLPIIGSLVKSTFAGSLPGRKDRLNEAMGLLAGMYQSLGFRRLAVSDGEWLGLLAAVQGQSYGKIIAGPGQFIAQAMTAIDVNFTGKRFEIEGAGIRRYGAIFGVKSYRLR